MGPFSLHTCNAMEINTAGSFKVLSEQQPCVLVTNLRTSESWGFRNVMIAVLKSKNKCNGKLEVGRNFCQKTYKKLAWPGKIAALRGI